MGDFIVIFWHNLSQLKTNTNHTHFFPTDYVYICDLHFFPSPHLPLFTFIMSVYHCRFSDVKLNSPEHYEAAVIMFLALMMVRPPRFSQTGCLSLLYPVSLCFRSSLFCSLYLSPWKKKHNHGGHISGSEIISFITRELE